MTSAWVSCPWCTLRVQGCRCAAPCGATWCERIIGAPHTNHAQPDPGGLTHA